MSSSDTSFSALREQHSALTYRSYSYRVTRDGLELTFELALEPNTIFTPRVVIHGVTQEMVDAIPEVELRTYVFHLGLAELPSYWKAACPPLVKIEAGSLSPDQIEWWHDLFIKGLGEFFFVNDIDPSQDDVLKIQAATSDQQPKASDMHQRSSREDYQRVLLPIGGGKDSAVTLDIMTQLLPKESLGAVLLNPTQAAIDITTVSGIEPIITISRTIDPKLLELNAQGYLNGHTPFSAYLAFLTVFVGRVFDYDAIAVSNERSANQGNIEFHGQNINHQYSKSFAFEQSFVSYASKFLASSPYYFSFLRPLYEVQIAQLFARSAKKESRYLESFRSCNRGHATNSWCGDCAKCLFAFVILYPFVDEDELVAAFGQNLFERDDLIPTAFDLVGKGPHKPLDCVGMYEESLAAYYLSYQKVKKDTKRLSTMLSEIYTKVIQKVNNIEQETQKILRGWDNEHGLPPRFEKMLREELFPNEE